MNIQLIKQWVKNNSPNGVTKLAALCNTSNTTIHQIINKNHKPNVEIVRHLARVLNVTTDAIIFPVNPSMDVRPRVSPEDVRYFQDELSGAQETQAG